ncbi:MAG: hypothetical protein ABI726_05665 [bacterium]
MTTKADFTVEEWDLILEGPTGAGLVVSAAERGGTFREAMSMAKAYAEARKQHGDSELLDEVVSAKPEVDRTRHGSFSELRDYSLERLRQAIAVVSRKATPEELADYRGFVVAVAERTAGAEQEGDEPVSEAERGAIAEIAEAVGPG